MKRETRARWRRTFRASSFPDVLKKLRLHLHDDLVICGKDHFSPELEALVNKIRTSTTEP